MAAPIPQTTQSPPHPLVEFARQHYESRAYYAKLCFAKAALRSGQHGRLNELLPIINAQVDSAFKKILAAELFHQGVRYSITLSDVALRDKCLLVCMSVLRAPDPFDPIPRQCIAAISDANLRLNAQAWYLAALQNSGNQHLSTALRV